MKIQPTTYDGYKLLHEGVLALADIEENGMCIDIEYCKKQQNHLARRIKHLEKKLLKDKTVKKWKKKYGSQFNFDSDTQMAKMFNVDSAKQEVMEQIGDPIIDTLILRKRLSKARNTYVANYIREAVDGMLHPFFHLHTTRSIRSSCSNINFQNQPVRIELIKKIVRRAVIPRPGNIIGEIDYSGQEVKVATCNHKDPEMIKELNDPSRDMHRDMAMMCYKVPKDLMTSKIRYCGKNKFVFPQFYGDYYVHNATDLWNAITTLNLELKNGIPLHKHLKSNKLGTYSKFESHIKKVEKYFWEDKFSVYADWKQQIWDDYCDTGQVFLYSGFVCSGYMERNKVINMPIQGPAFHCLLWSLIKINKWLKETGKQTKVIGQIHDSIVLDIYPPELNEVIEKCRKIMTEDIVTHWPWLIVQLKIDVELTPVDGSWYLKEEVKRADCHECGSSWMWQKEDGDEEYWECPVCENIETVPF